jgi:hypothetical protein
VHDNGAKAQSCIVQKFCITGGQSLLSQPSTMEKNFSFHFKRYNLTIRVVKWRETFFTCSPSSLVQEPMVENAKSEKNFIFSSWARNGRFGAFFEKNTLGPLGVKFDKIFFKKIIIRLLFNILKLIFIKIITFWSNCTLRKWHLIWTWSKKNLILKL